MVNKKWHCRNCGHDFEAEVFEKGEAEKKQVRVQALQCPKCNRTDVDEVRN